MRIYLDYAATAPVAPEVLDAMRPFFLTEFGNASSLHSYGRAARTALDDSRALVASTLGAGFDEILFTSGGTESDNMALIGVAMASRARGGHIITTRIEHHAVLETCRYLEREGFQVSSLPVDSQGIVDPEEIRKALTDRTILVSVMHANNEIGTIQPISEISKITREARVPLHTDAVQSVGSIPVNVQELGVDLLSLSAHKFHGPKGVGALYVRAGTRFKQLLYGGEQERARRPGTENIPGIVGLAKALEMATGGMEVNTSRIRLLRSLLVDGILSMVPGACLNGHPEKRLSGNANIRFPGIEAESLLIALDQEGIAVSKGSACSSGALEPSHVLRATGLTLQEAQESLRFSLGRYTTEEEIKAVLQILPSAVERFRG